MAPLTYSQKHGEFYSKTRKEISIRCLVLRDEYLAPIPEAERRDLILAYHAQLNSVDEETRIKAAKAWSKWEWACPTDLIRLNSNINLNAGCRLPSYMWTRNVLLGRTMAFSQGKQRSSTFVPTKSIITYLVPLPVLKTITSWTRFDLAYNINFRTDICTSHRASWERANFWNLKK